VKRQKAEGKGAGLRLVGARSYASERSGPVGRAEKGELGISPSWSVPAFLMFLVLVYLWKTQTDGDKA